MPNPEYVRIKITDIPAEFIEEYKLAGKAATVGSTLKFAAAAMAFPRPAF
jgi:hypothetical protein